jgi:hypothetical protein
MKPPLKIEQATLAVLEQALSDPKKTWHDIGPDMIKRNATERLAKKGTVEINQETGQFKLVRLLPEAQSE